MVAGTPALNLGADLANGAWIATLGDDDVNVRSHLMCAHGSFPSCRTLSRANESAVELCTGPIDPVVKRNRIDV
jgi:hypothetical protein